MKNSSLKGIILVGLGAASYGIVSSFIKKGAEAGYSTAELTFAQSFVGSFLMVLFNTISNKVAPRKANKPPRKVIIQLLIGGIPLGLTSTFYYLSLQYVPVSVCIVILMQSIWLGVILDFFINKVKPTLLKIIAIIIVLTGTVIATNILDVNAAIDWRGIFWGFLAAISYSLSFISTNNIARSYSPITRTMYLLIGSLIVICLVWGSSLIKEFDPKVLYTWGIALAAFGTIFPLLLFTRGMPLIGVGLGGIIASLELPVSVTVAHFFINEPVSLTQWFGIALILFAIILMNLSVTKPTKSN